MLSRGSRLAVSALKDSHRLRGVSHARAFSQYSNANLPTNIVRSVVCALLCERGGGGGADVMPAGSCGCAVAQGVRVVPEQSAWVVERFGRFSEVLAPGLHFLIPFVDKIAYVHSLKETAIKIPNQTAITNVWWACVLRDLAWASPFTCAAHRLLWQDNVTIGIDGVLYVKVVDPKDASYGVRAVLCCSVLCCAVCGLLRVASNHVANVLPCRLPTRCTQ